MTEMFGEAWSPMSVPDLAPDDDDDVCLALSGGDSFIFYGLGLGLFISFHHSFHRNRIMFRSFCADYALTN